MVENEKFRISIALIEKDEERLEPFLNFMEERDILSVGVDNYYLPTEKGFELYGQLVDQLESYVIHFEVFAYVDLEKGIFGDHNEDLLEGKATLPIIHALRNADEKDRSLIKELFTKADSRVENKIINI